MSFDDVTTLVSKKLHDFVSAQWLPSNLLRVGFQILVWEHCFFLKLVERAHVEQFISIIETWDNGMNVDCIVIHFGVERGWSVVKEVIVAFPFICRSLLFISDVSVIVFE